MERIKEVCKNLYIEDVEVRTDEDPDVKPYIKEIDIKWVKVMLPPDFMDVQRFLKGFLRARMQKLKKYGILRRSNLN